ncbi:MAG TPA: thioredoxin family protein [Chitinophagaceae bacterium]|nr:thioredoxin family protein [Chitinophagaceae bacterium]
MKRILLAATALTAIGLMSFHTLNEALPLGADMPKADVKLKDISGKEITLKDAKKQNGLLVMFSCNTCPYVVKNQSRTNDICKYALSKGIGVVILNSNEANRSGADSYAEMQAYAKAQGYDWYYAVDQNNVLADAFGALRTPECFLFDKSGKLVYHGAIDDNPSDASKVSRNHLKEAINEASTGKDVSVKRSKSVGCGIKRI